MCAVALQMRCGLVQDGAKYVCGCRRYTAHGPLAAFFFWVKSWALPGMGMFCEVTLQTFQAIGVWS